MDKLTVTQVDNTTGLELPPTKSFQSRASRTRSWLNYPVGSCSSWTPTSTVQNGGGMQYIQSALAVLVVRALPPPLLPLRTVTANSTTHRSYPTYLQHWGRISTPTQRLTPSRNLRSSIPHMRSRSYPTTIHAAELRPRIHLWHLRRHPHHHLCQPRSRVAILSEPSSRHGPWTPRRRQRHHRVHARHFLCLPIHD